MCDSAFLIILFVFLGVVGWYVYWWCSGLERIRYFVVGWGAGYCVEAERSGMGVEGELNDAD